MKPSFARKISIYIVIIALLLVGANIAYVRLITKFQLEEVIDIRQDSIQAQLSHFYLPVVIELKKIENVINQKIPQLIFVDSTYSDHDNDNVKVLIERNGLVDLMINDDFLEWSFPLRVHVDLQYNKGIFREKMVEQSVDFEMILHFNSSYSIESDWGLVTETALREIEWVKKPKLDIGLIKIGLTKRVERILESREPELLSLIDNLVAKNVNFEPTISKIWNGIQKPIAIKNKVTTLYLKAEPTNVEITGFEPKRTRLVIHLLLNGYFTTQLDTANWTKNDSVPNFVYNEKAQRKTELSIISEFTLMELNQIVKQNLLYRQITIKGIYAIEIKDVELFEKHGRLGLKLSVSGDAKGYIVMLGVPYYSPTKEAIAIDKFDFAIETNDALLQVAKWIYDDDFKALVQSNLVFPVSEQMSNIPDLIVAGIERQKIGDRIDVNIKELFVKPEAMSIQADKIMVSIKLEATASMKITKLLK